MSERPTVYRCGNLLFFPRQYLMHRLDGDHPPSAAFDPHPARVLPFPSARRRSPAKPPLPHPA